MNCVINTTSSSVCTLGTDIISVELEITISGDYWSSKTKIITGAGSVYDNENTQYENGILKGLLHLHPLVDALLKAR